MDGPGIRTYYGRPDGSKIDVAAAVPLDVDLDALDGLELVELAAEAEAASILHRGPAAEIGDAWHTMDVELERCGLESYGVHRQVYLGGDEAAGWSSCSARCGTCPGRRLRSR